MALQFILGASGTGKTTYLYGHITRLAAEHPETDYYFIVPEQFTLQTQKELVQHNPAGGIFNIDVLSLARLAHKVFEELGREQRKVLKDIGKSMVMKRVLSECRDELVLFGANAGQNGFVEEAKSLLSELFQYGIGEAELLEMIEENKEKELLCKKLADILLLLRKFRELLGEQYMTSEGIYDALAECIGESRCMKNCVVVLEGFTGFTPSQYELLRKLLRLAKTVYLSVTIPKDAVFAPKKEHDLFAMSRNTVQRVTKLAEEVRCEVLEPVEAGAEDYRHPAGSTLHHLWGSLFRYPVKSNKKETDGELTVYAGADAKAECRYAVTKILHLIQQKGYRYRDIAVIVSDINQYGELMEQELTNSGIPCFLDYKKNMSENTFAEYLKAVLRLAEAGLHTEGVLSYVKNALSGWEKEQVWSLENYCLALGIKGYQFEKEWKRTYRTRTEVSLEELNSLRKRLVSEVKPLIDVFQNPEATVEDRTRTLFYFLKDHGLEQRLKQKEEEFLAKGDRLRAREYAQVYRVVLELFDHLVELLGKEKITPKEYRELVETGLREAKVGLIPTGSEQIVIGDMERTRLKEIRALFFLGVNDGKVPPVSGNQGILSDKDRKELSGERFELAPDPVTRAGNGQFYLYMNLTKPSERLYLTYAAVGTDGKTVRTSYLIGKLKALFPSLVIRTEYDSEAESLVQNDKGRRAFLTSLREFAAGEAESIFGELYRWHADNIWEEELERLIRQAVMQAEKEQLSAETAKALYGNTIVGSVTRMEQYARCAFAHFLKYGLSLEERQEYRLQAPDIGNLYHDGLKRFGEEVLAMGKKWQEISVEERSALAERCAKKAVEEYSTDIFTSSARNRYLTKQMERVLKKTLDILTVQLAGSDFLPEAFEKSFFHTDRNLSLYGIIDRVDSCETEQGKLIKIVDYKSGTRDFSMEELYYGLSMQLAMYMTAVLRDKENKDAVPAAMFFYHVDDPIVDKSDHAEKEVLKKQRVKGLVNSKREIVRRLDHEFQDAAGGLAASVKSLRIPVETDKEGQYKKSSKVADSAMFEAIFDYVYRKLKEESEEILSGSAEIAPYKCRQRTGCDYCSYASVCGFDKKSGSRYRMLEPLSDEDVFEKLREGRIENLDNGPDREE
ncbi:MAG: PD-(D/E)XK nuclease family protein [Lachnospiraceae bacterium]|nr:PD-(D/E)XK nuclease family protein [Lachnospiraceae bacterium]